MQHSLPHRELERHLQSTQCNYFIDSTDENDTKGKTDYILTNNNVLRSRLIQKKSIIRLPEEHDKERMLEQLELEVDLRLPKLSNDRQ